MGSVTRLSTSGFFHESVSPKPLSIPLGSFQIFAKIRRDIRSSRFATGVNDTGRKCKRSSIIKVLIIQFGHLLEVQLTYGKIFSFKFTLRSQQPDIVSIICHRYQQHKRNWWQNLPPVLLTPVANLPPVLLIPVVHLYLRISPRIFAKNSKRS